MRHHGAGLRATFDGAAGWPARAMSH